MSDSSDQASANLKGIAHAEFETALRRGFWRSVLSWFTQRNNKLLPFDEVRKALPIHGQYYSGLHVIPLDKVVGSVARYNDFDRAFIPRQRHTRQRWINIDIAKLTDVPLPAIEVYKIGEIYFVKDGNHRVSVAREKGQVFIDAQVTEIVTQVEVNEKTDINELIREQEYRSFLETTQLAEVRPEARIELSIPGQYDKLLEHISVHRWFMGERWQRPITPAEAVAGWYDEVYLPLAKTIEDQKILKEFPGRTVSDLYLWVIEHLWFLRTEYQKDVSLSEAATHFAQEFSKKPLSRLNRLFSRLAEVMADQTPAEMGMPPDYWMTYQDESGPTQQESSGEPESPDEKQD